MPRKPTEDRTKQRRRQGSLSSLLENPPHRMRLQASPSSIHQVRRYGSSRRRPSQSHLRTRTNTLPKPPLTSVVPFPPATSITPPRYPNTRLSPTHQKTIPHALESFFPIRRGPLFPNFPPPPWAPPLRRWRLCCAQPLAAKLELEP